MGIQQLSKILKKFAQKSIKSNVPITTFSNKIIGIDASIYFYKFLYHCNVQKNEYLLTELFFSQIVYFLERRIVPVYIFDGKPPIEKQGEIEKRKILKEQKKHTITDLQITAQSLTTNISNLTDEKNSLISKQKKLQKQQQIALKQHRIHALIRNAKISSLVCSYLFKNKYDIDICLNSNKHTLSDINTKENDLKTAELELDRNNTRQESLNNSIIHLKASHISELKHLLTLMHLPFIQGEGETDSLCAQLAKDNTVDAILSEDTDLIALGTPVLLRNMKNNVIDMYNHNDLLADIGFTRAQFIDMCILCGCDYVDKLNLIGPMNAYKWIKQYQTIENAIKLVNNARSIHQIPENYLALVKQARHIFHGGIPHSHKRTDFSLPVYTHINIENIEVFMKKHAPTINTSILAQKIKSITAFILKDDLNVKDKEYTNSATVKKIKKIKDTKDKEKKDREKNQTTISTFFCSKD
jgi:5'-3' exonuclease